jgi:hypothetical protein
MLPPFALCGDTGGKNCGLGDSSSVVAGSSGVLVPNTVSMARFVRSALPSIRWVYVRKVKPGSACPRYSLTALMVSPSWRAVLA